MHTKKEIKTSDWKRGKNVDKKEKKQMQQEAYNEYVKQVTPTHNLAANMAKAFLVGGVICVIGQFILNICRNYGLDKDTSGSWCSMLLVLLSVLLTGFNIIRRSQNSAAQAHSSRSPVLPIPLPLRRSNSKRRDRFSGSAVRSLRSRDRSSYMEYFRAGCLDLFTGS